MYWSGLCPSGCRCCDNKPLLFPACYKKYTQFQVEIKVMNTFQSWMGGKLTLFCQWAGGFWGIPVPCRDCHTLLNSFSLPEPCRNEHNGDIMQYNLSAFQSRMAFITPYTLYFYIHKPCVGFVPCVGFSGWGLYEASFCCPECQPWDWDLVGHSAAFNRKFNTVRDYPHTNKKLVCNAWICIRTIYSWLKKASIRKLCCCKKV